MEARHRLKTAVKEAMGAAAKKACEDADDKQIFAMTEQQAKSKKIFCDASVSPARMVSSIRIYK